MANNEEQLYEINESDCCGNGCTNCILDKENEPRECYPVLATGQRNVILNYTKFELLHKETLDTGDNTQVLQLHFSHAATDQADEDPTCILIIPTGRHIMLRAVLEPNGTPLLRPYSPYWVDVVKKQFKILVKLQPGGRMSDYLDALKPQDILEFRGPIGHFAHNAKAEKHIIIIAQGVAVAPTIPLVNQVLDNAEDMNRLHHLVCARNIQHIYFRSDLREFARYWNYKYCIYLTREQCGDPACQQSGHCSASCKQFRLKSGYQPMLPQRLDANALAAYCEATALTTRPSSQLQLIIAGHTNFQNTMRELVVNTLSVQQENIFLL